VPGPRPAKSCWTRSPGGRALRALKAPEQNRPPLRDGKARRAPARAVHHAEPVFERCVRYAQRKRLLRTLLEERPRQGLSLGPFSILCSLFVLIDSATLSPREARLFPELFGGALLNRIWLIPLPHPHRTAQDQSPAYALSALTERYPGGAGRRAETRAPGRPSLCRPAGRMLDRAIVGAGLGRKSDFRHQRRQKFQIRTAQQTPSAQTAQCL
jgi:hypothetical protein